MTSKHSKAVRSGIDASEDYECRYWSEKFGVTAGELKHAVNKVGPVVEDRELEKATRVV
jgi:hypothetical protein